MSEKNFLGHPWAVWVAVTIAIALRVWAEPPKNETAMGRAFALLFSAACGGVVAIYLYRPVVEWRGLQPDTWDVPVALLLGFTGESFVRFIINVIEYEKVKELLAVWRGNAKGGSHAKKD